VGLAFSVLAQSGQGFTTLKINHKEAAAIDLQDLATDISVVKLENTDEAIFGEVGKLIVTSKRIYIAAGMPAPRVFAFDRKGKFLFRVMGTGDGPGEVNRVTNIAVDGEDLMVYGDLSRRVLHYSPDGVYQAEYKVDFFANHFIKTETGWLFNLQQFSSGENGGARFASVDENFKTQQYFYRPQVTSLGYASGFNFFRRAPSGLRFTISQSDTIMNISNGMVRPEFLIDFGKYKLSKALKEQPYSRDIIGRTRKSNYAQLWGIPHSVAGLVGFIYLKNNANGDRSKLGRKVYFEPENGKIRWHLYRLDMDCLLYTSDPADE